VLMVTQDEDSVRVQVGAKGWEVRRERAEETNMVVMNDAISRASQSVLRPDEAKFWEHS
jgi:hypothetical protein